MNQSPASSASGANPDQASPTQTRPDLDVNELREVIVRLARQMRRRGDNHELPAGALSALSALVRHGSMTVGELARHEQVTQPLITRITATLTEAGLVARVADPGDARVTRLVVQPAGARLMEQRWAAASIWLSERINRLDLADRARLGGIADVLERLIALPDEDPAAGARHPVAGSRP